MATVIPPTVAAAVPTATDGTPASFLASPTMATPRPLTATLVTPTYIIPHTADPSPRLSAPVEEKRNASPADVAPADREVGNGADRARLSRPVINVHDSADAEDTDGRSTPLASESSKFSHGTSSVVSDAAPSMASEPSSVGFPPRSSSASNGTPSEPQAEIGLSSLETEELLRTQLSGKDRMFLLLLSKEVEAFIVKVVQDEASMVAIPAPTQSGTISGMLCPTHLLTSNIASKFQRMLAYKVAEWYGLKGTSSPDGGIYIGVLGLPNEKSSILRLADLAPKPPSPKQSFKLMQRVPLGSSTSPVPGSANGDESNEAGGSRRKTFEEREAEYALARERIYGRIATDNREVAVGVQGVQTPPRTASPKQPQLDDEVDPIPRRLPSDPHQPDQPIYASLYHPPKDPASVPNPTVLQPQHVGAQHMGYQPPDAPFNNVSGPQFAFGRIPPGDFPSPQPYGHIPQQPAFQPPQQQHQAYMDQSAFYGRQQPFDPRHWQQLPQSTMAPGHLMLGPPPLPMSQPSGWSYNGIPVPNPGQMMPPIPQGSQPYPPHHAFPPQNQGPPLMQPTPTRPGPFPQYHSSTSSSVSSRSYQDCSRPHSRGSTTSTRSATSSVRFGHRYPASAQSGPGNRQKGMKGQGMNGLTALAGGDRRSVRGHSPSSVTTTSSRSSRRTGSITLQPPAEGQHQLPQRPDWAANNIPYHPSPATSQVGTMPGPMPLPPSTSDFPPLHRQGTMAEPMQVERAKMRVNSGNVWNGAGGRAIQQNQQPHNGQQAYPSNGGYPAQVPPPGHLPSLALDGQGVAARGIAPAMASASPRTPKVAATTENDPDFPRRMPSTRAAPTLYDPSAPTPTSRPGSTDGTQLSAHDVIEAKLAALSVTSGISIGPAPVKPPSYAKIVKRD